MFPRGALVAGGFAVVAGGAVYLLRNESPEPTEAPDVDPRVKWVVDSGDPSARMSDAALAIPDPLHDVAAGGRSGAASGLLASASQEKPVPFHPSRSSLRPAYVADPALPPRFAAPASARFASQSQGTGTMAQLAPLEDPTRGPLASPSAPETLAFAPPSLAQEEASASRPVGIGRHLIQDGDTLEEIALRNYGDASLAPFLYERNRRILKYPDLLPVGKEIVLYAPPENARSTAPASDVPSEFAIVAAPPTPGASLPSSSLPGIAPPELAPLE